VAGLDTLLVLRPPPSDPNLFKALDDAEKRLEEKRAAQAKASIPRQEEEKGLPLAGIAAVAFILLLVSGALFYLHMQSKPAPLHQAIMPRAGALAPATRANGASAPAKAAQAGQAAAGETGTPALLTASDPNRALAATRPDSAAEDLQLLEAAARHGDREAQFRIGSRFLSDSTIEGGAATAARWLSRAADQGHVEAQFMLASLFERGAGVSKDEAQAIALYRKAAAGGHVRAMHNLGVLLSARGWAQDYREAAGWFNRAAQAGLADSQYNLALLYERGLGVEQDLSRAYFWYSVAAKAGDKEATRQAGRLKRTLPAEETAATGEEAGSWQPVLEESSKHAAHGNGARG
jgi:localization factor PodJL